MLNRLQMYSSSLNQSNALEKSSATSNTSKKYIKFLDDCLKIKNKKDLSFARKKADRILIKLKGQDRITQLFFNFLGSGLTLEEIVDAFKTMREKRQSVRKIVEQQLKSNLSQKRFLELPSFEDVKFPKMSANTK